MKTILSRLLLFAILVATSLAAEDAALPSQEIAIGSLGLSGFKEEAQQIPATVIDTGILKFVPYVSYRVGEDRELNIYGDLAAPACVEIGLYRGFLSSDEEKQKCLMYLRRIFPAVDFSSLRLTGGKMMKGGIVVEVTSPDSPDAYGGWWISAYSLPLLHAAAGTSASVSSVSVAREPSGTAGEWSSSDLSQARPSSSGPGGRVYVRSYIRKDGTYVRSHSRSK
jgi:hypothetical protein